MKKSMIVMIVVMTLVLSSLVFASYPPTPPPISTSETTETSPFGYCTSSHITSNYWMVAKKSNNTEWVLFTSNYPLRIGYTGTYYTVYATSNGTYGHIAVVSDGYSNWNQYLYDHITNTSANVSVGYQLKDATVYSANYNVLNQQTGEKVYDYDVIYSANLLSEINSASDSSTMINLILNNDSYVGVIRNNYDKYVTTRQENIRNNLYSLKPFATMNDVKTNFEKYTALTYKTYTLPTSTNKLIITNGTATEQTINFKCVGATFRANDYTTWLGAIDHTNYTSSNLMDTLTIKANTTNTNQAWLQTSTVNIGKIYVYIPVDTGLSVNVNDPISIISPNGDGSMPDIIDTTPTEFQENMPDRNDYETGFGGDIAYTLDKFIYYITMPFTAIGEFVGNIITTASDMMQSVGQVPIMFSTFFSYMPIPLASGITLGVSAVILVGIWSFIRGRA